MSTTEEPQSTAEEPPKLPAAGNAKPGIRLDHFLQSQSVVQTGGHAKIVIQDGQVTVDGVTETRRRRKLQPGTCVGFNGQQFHVS